MTTYSSELKDPRTCRIFFSSPFRGMEQEREILTRKYFPQIHQLCNSRGIQFVPVDMRWGITSEAAENAQTVNICLRELDRSDIFAGFFGQRYGWCGREDEALQKNIDNAVHRYPWLDQHRDKSVTEWEFLHGHLNTPGTLPAVICFRDKQYDEAQRSKAEAEGDQRGMQKFSAESDESVKKIDDLKQRVDGTRDKALGVDLSYNTPEQAASFIFEHIWRHMKEVLFKDTSTPMSPRQKALTFHDAFIANRSRLYVGGEKYFDTFRTKLLEQEECRPIAVCGVAGSGKSALLCNWIQRLREDKSGAILAYHFIGTDPGSDSPSEILTSLIRSVRYHLTGEEESTDQEKTTQKEVRELMSDLQQCLQDASEQTRTIIIIIDGLDKVPKAARADKPLYWLSEQFPRRVKVVVSTKDDDAATMAALTEKKFDTLTIEPLSSEERTQMCVRTLATSGKEFSASQLDKVVSAPHSGNAFFLRVAISELSVFGYFRKLDEKIDSLVKCDGVSELFREYLIRLENDYNVPEFDGNLVKRVLTTLLVCHEGMSENELMEILDIPSHIWSPLFFALENYVISRSGVLGFAFSELGDAVKVRYVTSAEDRKAAIQPVIAYFDAEKKKFNVSMELLAEETRRTCYELPWLLRDVEDWDGLADTLANIWIFSRLLTECQYDLLELWKSTRYSFTKVASMYMHQVDLYVADKYLELADTLQDERTPGTYMLNTLQNIFFFLGLAHAHGGREPIVRRMINILEHSKGRGMSEVKRQFNLVEKRNSLATLLVDEQRYEEGHQLHLQNIQYYERCLETKELKESYCWEKIGWAYNGIGVMYYLKQEMDEALTAHEKALSIYRRLDSQENIRSSLENIALIYIDQGKLDEAITNLETSKKILEEIHFGSAHHELGNVLTNLALCYRRQMKLDDAEDMYKKSLEVKATAVGWDHPIIATAMLNLSVLERARGNFEKAYEYICKAVNIYEVNEIPEDTIEHRRALENKMSALQDMDREEEAEPIFRRVFDILTRNNVLHECLAHAFNKMIAFYYNNQKYGDAERVAVALMNTKKANTMTYFLMDVIDKNNPPETPRPEVMTLDYGLKLWPGDPTLGQQKARNHLIPAGDIDNLLPLLASMVNPQYNTAIYDVGATWCVEADRKDMAMQVLKAGHEAYPDHLAFITRLVDLCHTLKLYGYGQVYARLAMERVSDNPALYLIGGYMILMWGDVPAAKQAFNKVLTMGNEDLANRAKDLLEKLVSFEASQEKSDTGITD